jgi:hypothetical protein
MTLVVVLCSRSAHDKNVLARRPQEDHHECHSTMGTASELGGKGEGQIRGSSVLAERAASEVWEGSR